MLSEYGICKDSTLHLLHEPRGGGVLRLTGGKDEFDKVISEAEGLAMVLFTAEWCET